MVDVSNQILMCVDLGKTHLPCGGGFRVHIRPSKNIFLSTHTLQIHLSQTSICSLEGELFVFWSLFATSPAGTKANGFILCFILLYVQHKGLSH